MEGKKVMIGLNQLVSQIIGFIKVIDEDSYKDFANQFMLQLETEIPTVKMFLMNNDNQKDTIECKASQIIEAIGLIPSDSYEDFAQQFMGKLDKEIPEMKKILTEHINDKSADEYKSCDEGTQEEKKELIDDNSTGNTTKKSSANQDYDQASSNSNSKGNNHRKNNKKKKKKNKNKNKSILEDNSYADNLSVKNICMVSCGLANLGNTCFLNVIIQCFAHFNEFQAFFLDYRPKSDLTTSLRSLSLAIREKKNPNDLLREFTSLTSQAENYGDGHQYDAKEFYSFIIAEVLKDTPVLKPYCIIVKTENYHFTGNCKHNDTIETLYPFIPLTGVDWRREFEEFFQGVTESGNLYCVKCKKNQKGTRNTAYVYPKVLPVYFHQPTPITLGSSLSVVKKNMNKQGRGKDEFIEYRAEVIIMRRGNNKDSGHFLAVAQEAEYCILYNDSIAKCINPQEFTAYMVFYRKISQ